MVMTLGTEAISNLSCTDKSEISSQSETTTHMREVFIQDRG